MLLQAEDVSGIYADPFKSAVSVEKTMIVDGEGSLGFWHEFAI
jgi:hypothetical protein